MRRSTILVVLTLGLAPVAASARAQAPLDAGRAATRLWSGPWWPIRFGGILEPLDAYDRLTGRDAGAIERRLHPPEPDAPEWHGYCHAWAASTVWEAEPTEPRSVVVEGRATTLSTDDQKGLLALLHAADVAEAYGTRMDPDSPPAARDDLAPLELAAEAVGIAERQVQGKIGVRDHPLPLGGAMGRVGSGRAIGSRLHPPSPKRGETSCRAPGRPIKNFSCRPRAGARIDKSGRARRQIRALRARIVKQSLTSLQARRTRSRQSGGIRTGALHAGRHGRKHHAQTQCRSDHPVGGPRRP